MSNANRFPTPRWRSAVAGAIGLMLAATSLHAQSTLNPTVAEFSPSADHNVVVNGTALVTSYELGFYLLGAPLPLQTQSLGKPAPGADGKIRVAFSTLSSLLAAIPSLGLLYEARVSAVGPGGTRTSSASNSFTFNSSGGSCTYTVTPTSRSVSSSATTGSVSVTTTSGCGWNAATGDSWLTLTGSTTGSGSGTVSYSVAANTASSSRTGALTVAGKTVSISQSGRSCSFSVTPTSHTVSASGGSISGSVTGSSGCSWTSSESASWLSLTAGSGSGNGTYRASVSANTGSSQRSATFTVAGQSISVTQHGAACPVTLSSTSVIFGLAGGTGSVAVTAANSCYWTAQSSASWLTITAGASDNGRGTVRFSARSMSGAPRVATITIGGQSFTVTQGAPPAAPTGVRVVHP